MPYHIVKIDNKDKITANIEGASTQASTPTPEVPVDVLPLQTDPTTGTDIANLNLHGAGTYKDIYNYLTKKITRNIGIKILDGSETWQESSGEYYFNIPQLNGTTSWVGFSTHFPCTNSAGGASGKFYFGGGATNNGNVLFQVSETYTLSEWTDYLAAQYAAGTPVTIYYPLATPVEKDTDNLLVVRSLVTSKYAGTAVLNITGKNIFDAETLITTGTHYDDGTMLLSISDETAWTTKPTILLKPGTYTLSAQFSNKFDVDCRISANENIVHIYSSTADYKYATFTITEDTLLCCKATSQSATVTDSVGWIQLEIGSAPTLPFEKYFSTSSYLPQTFHAVVRTQEAD